MQAGCNSPRDDAGRSGCVVQRTKRKIPGNPNGFLIWKLCEGRSNWKKRLSTNGLLLPEYAEELAEAGVGFITVTVNCTEPKAGIRLYSYVYYEDKMYRGKDAPDILFHQQAKGIELAKKMGMFVKINCVAIEGINVDQIKKVAELAGKLQCDIMNIIPLLPVPGSELENERPPSCETIEFLRRICWNNIRQMTHCNRCRADAVGRLK